MNIRLYVMDLANFSSIQLAASEIIRKEPRLDVLLNNAGIGYAEGNMTKDGNELLYSLPYTAADVGCKRTTWAHISLRKSFFRY